MKKFACLLLPTLVLASCGGQDTPTVTAYTSISGTVREPGAPDADDTVMPTTAWTGGAGTVQATVAGAGPQGTASGALSSGGAFTLTLPADVTTQALSSDAFLLPGTAELSCTGTPSISDAAARFAALDVAVQANRQGQVAPSRVSLIGTAADPVGLKSESGTFIYADRPVSVTGAQTCTITEAGQTYAVTSSLNMTLGRGWNKTTATLAVTATQLSLSLSSGTFPTEEWVYLGGSTLAGAAAPRPAFGLELPAALNTFRFPGLR